MTEDATAAARTRRSAGTFSWAVVVVVLLAGGLGGWASTAEISGALIAHGSIVVDSNVKKVQHPTGGVVGEVRVRDGDRVKAGDILIRLDLTVTRANLAIVTKGLTELYARKARLAAERDGAETVAVPKELADKVDDPEVQEALASERKLFELRRKTRVGQKDQLEQRVKQLREQITGLTAQQDAKSKEMSLIEQELEGVRDLWAKNLVQFNRLTSLEREDARLQGERGQLIAAAAEAKGKIVETELQILQIDQEFSQRRRQGAARSRQQDRRICRAQSDGRGSAQAHRYPRAAGWRGFPVDREHCRRGHHRRRRDHAISCPRRIRSWSRPRSIPRISIRSSSASRSCFAFPPLTRVRHPSSMAPLFVLPRIPTPISAPGKVSIWSVFQ